MLQKQFATQLLRVLDWSDFRWILPEIRQMCQKFEDVRGIELQNDKLGGFRGILSETVSIRQKFEDSRRIVLKNDKLGGFPRNFAGNPANSPKIGGFPRNCVAK